MKRNLFVTFAAVLLLLGMTGCSNDDNSPSEDIKVQEKDLVGIWWNAFEYADVTETGTPFNWVLLAVKADADHTGCIYLGVFDKADSTYPLAIYGGPEDAGFTWKLLDDGSVLLGDPASGESLLLARRFSGKNYGEDMTNVSSTKLTYNGGSVTLDNGNYSGTLAKADAEKVAEIEKMMEEQIKDVNSGDATIGLEGFGDHSARARRFLGID